MNPPPRAGVQPWKRCCGSRKRSVRRRRDTTATTRLVRQFGVRERRAGEALDEAHLSRRRVACWRPCVFPQGSRWHHQSREAACGILASVVMLSQESKGHRDDEIDCQSQRSTQSTAPLLLVGVRFGWYRTASGASQPGESASTRGGRRRDDSLSPSLSLSLSLEEEEEEEGAPLSTDRARARDERRRPTWSREPNASSTAVM